MTDKKLLEHISKLVQTAFVTLKPAEESFRQGWKEVMQGEALPISELWEGIDAK